MSQQIINIPINWDDDLFNNIINKAVINEVKDRMEKEAMRKLGFDRYAGYTQMFENIVRDCMREIVNENKDLIIKEIISRGTKSLTSSKEYKEAKKKVGVTARGEY